MDLGTIVGIDRANSVVTAQIDGSTLVVPASYLGHPPPPLTRCYFEATSPGIWLCHGCLTDVRQVLHDDFLSVNGPGGDGSIGYGDTPWHLTDNPGNSTVTQSGAASMTGAVVLTVAASPTGKAILLKPGAAANVDVPVSPAAIHVSARFSVSQLPSSSAFVLGLVNAFATIGITVAGSGVASAIISTDSSPFFSTATIQATALAVNTPYIVDLLVNTTSVSGWFGGDGPYTITAPASLPSGSGQPCCAYVNTQPGAPAAAMTVDYYELALVGAVVDPATLSRVAGP